MHAVAAPVLYVPAGHSVHVAAPELLNRPAGQGAAVALVDPTGQKYPAWQSPLQLEDTAPALPNFPALHCAVHDAVGEAPRPYNPAGQSTHALAPRRLYLPAGQTAAVALVLPARQKYPAVHWPTHVTRVCPPTSP